METYYKKYIDVHPIGGFSTLYFAKQEFGEVEPAFVRRFPEELPEKWIFMDYRFDGHIVKFNKDETHPLLMDGWHEMREVFDLHQNEDLNFAYYGKGLFGLMGSRRFESEDQASSFHSCCVTPGTFVRFQVELTAENINNLYLCKWNDFANFLRESNFKVITACSDNGTKTVFKVAIHDEPLEITAIRHNWFGFCRQSGFRASDEIRFRFSLITPGRNVVRVFKI